MRRLALAVLCPLLLALAACGGGSGGSSAGSALPTVSGTYGVKPTLHFPSGGPGSTLRSTVLHQGTGKPVGKGDLLVADYLGQVWRGKVFDNSYDRGEPAAFAIGVGKVIPGWDKTLVGVKAGSRILMVVPPADGYGTAGNSDAGIKGTDTLVFVVDVIGSYGKDAAGDPHAVPQHPPAGEPTVTGALGQRPTVTVPKGTKPPTKVTVTVLAKGSGAPLKDGLVIAQYEAVAWTGKAVDSTWTGGTPAAITIAKDSPLSALEGVPVGSRVLVELPAQDSSKAATDSDALVLDVVAQPGPAKDQAAG